MVGLVHYVDTPTITEFIEIFAIRIMRSAQEVDVALFHESDILLVGSVVDKAPCLRMMIMAIHTTQLHILSVDLKHLTNNFHLLHTQMVVEMLNDLPFLIA